MGAIVQQFDKLGYSSQSTIAISKHLTWVDPLCPFQNTYFHMLVF